MLVKFLLFLLVILQATKSDTGKVTFRIRTCGFYKVNNNQQLTLEFDKLEEFKTEQKEYINVKFDKIRIFHLSLDGINDGKSPCGLELIDSDKEGYHISYSAGYYKGNNFDFLLPLWCLIQQYEFGLVFFDKNKDADTLNNVNEVHTVEHAVLITIKSINNKVLLGSRLHNKDNIIIGLCPYINWVNKKRWIEFIPEDHIKDNGFFEEENGYAHIVVPYYKKNHNAKEFICGKLKQPTLPDLLIGFKLNENDKTKEIDGVINPLNEEIKCQSSDNPQYYYHFGYSETDTNYMSERMMDAMEIRNKDSNYKFYAGQKIYIYKWDDISDNLRKPGEHFRITDNPHVTEEASCIKNLNSDIKANILPTIGSVDSIQKHQEKNIFYRLIKLDDLYQNFIFRCLSKVEGINKAHMDEFYSRAAEYSIKNAEKPNIIYTSSKNGITFDRENIDNYGSYRCKELKTTKFFSKSVITMDKVYYLPDEGSELLLKDLKGNNKQYIGCVKQYESLGEIKKIRIEFGDNVRKPINIENFSKATNEIDIKENLVIYKSPKDVSGVLITCIYQTPAETTFYTKRQISFFIRGGNKNKNVTIFATSNDKTVDQYVDNSASWITAIVATVILSCIVVIMVAHMIVRRTRKRKMENGLSSSISFSGSSSLSRSSNKGSNGMSGIKKKATGQGKDNSNLIIIKMNKNGHDSKTSTTSNSVTGNSTSTDLGKKHFKNVKLVAK
uniref:Candidate secreted effector protein n=1 Tax=Strongyloides venezuelensis TaxID=75913 RepID=A0A0K0EZZ4_STRVS